MKRLTILITLFCLALLPLLVQFAEKKPAFAE